ncbi:MAG: DUF116 domain-containing protein [Bacillota bacterium]|jgi:hypothetical protein|nr:DUF116 domain-containing protein [Clostridia bacterium]
MKTKKRLFIGLISASLLSVIGLLFLMWFLAINRGTPFYRFLLVLAGGFFLGIVTLVGFGIVGMVLTLYKAQAFPSFQGSIRMATNLLFPLALGIGRVFNINRNKVKSSFIEVNNQLVSAQKVKVPPEKVMVLAPHCLQKSSCPYKITINILNCRKCGGCVVQDLRDLTEKYGVILVVATGGTLARKFIEKYRPHGIVAIACERDLTSGILDVNPLPVLGVLNERPQGPCYNTCVNIPQVEKAIRFFIEK